MHHYLCLKLSPEYVVWVCVCEYRGPELLLKHVCLLGIKVVRHKSENKKPNKHHLFFDDVVIADLILKMSPNNILKSQCALWISGSSFFFWWFIHCVFFSWMDLTARCLWLLNQSISAPLKSLKCQTFAFVVSFTQGRLECNHFPGFLFNSSKCRQQPVQL